MADEIFGPEIRFSLHDLTLIVGDQYEDLSEEGRKALRALVIRDLRFTDQLAEIRSMACELETHCVLFAWDVYEKWETLQSNDGWEPLLAMLSEGDAHIWYEDVLRLARKSAEGTENPSRILAIKSRLEVALQLLKSAARTPSSDGIRVEALRFASSGGETTSSDCA